MIWRELEKIRMTDYRDKTLSFEAKLRALYDELEGLIGDASLGN